MSPRPGRYLVSGFRQQDTTTRLWATKGGRPRAVKQQQFEDPNLFGAVYPAKGEGETEVLFIMDGAGWHSDNIAQGINNLRGIIKLPPYSPELNPIEQGWNWLRQHHLANRCFSGNDDIVDASSIAWNDFVSDVKRVTKMCSRGWLEVGNN